MSLQEIDYEEEANKHAISTETEVINIISNGKKVAKTIEKIKYSDGSTEIRETLHTTISS